MRKRGLGAFLLACAMAGCRSAEPAAAPAPAPAPARVVPPDAPPPPPPAGDPGTEVANCRVVNGRMVRPDSTIFAGDTAIGGQHASMATWFVNDAVITFQRHRYVKYGLPRVLEIGEVVNVGSYRGVPVFATPDGDREWPEIIYLSFSPSCEFQPYQSNRDVGAVRG